MYPAASRQQTSPAGVIWTTLIRLSEASPNASMNPFCSKREMIPATVDCATQNVRSSSFIERYFCSDCRYFQRQRPLTNSGKCCMLGKSRLTSYLPRKSVKTNTMSGVTITRSLIPRKSGRKYHRRHLVTRWSNVPRPAQTR